MFCMLGGIFAFLWLSDSVAGRGVVNTWGPKGLRDSYSWSGG